MQYPNCSGLCFLKVSLLVPFIILLFSPPVIFHLFLTGDHFADLELVQQRATKMVRELDHMMHEEKLTSVFIMGKKWLAEGLLIVFSSLKMCYREEGARFLDVQNEMKRCNGQSYSCKNSRWI